jgi:hypothetical protein
MPPANRPAVGGSRRSRRGRFLLAFTPSRQTVGGICGKDDLSGVACGEIAISLREAAEDFPLLFGLLPLAGLCTNRLISRGVLVQSRGFWCNARVKPLRDRISAA